MRKTETKNHRLFIKACRHLVGGVDSPVRSFQYVGIEPRIIKKGKGAYLWDYDGNKYLDYVLSWGAAILGHAHPVVLEGIQATAKRGLHFGATTLAEIEFAEAIKKAIPFVDKVRFVNSGTEAVMGAVRLARGYTRRDLILKFEHAYHGHADYLLAKSGSGCATLGIPASSGIPKDFTKSTLIVPLGDVKAVQQIFNKYGKRIAAVLVEPVGGNFGVIPPDVKFLQYVRRITRKFGVLLIFDEVITGFRFHYGPAASIFGVKPDIITLGKIIGGGLPIGAYAGKDKIMSRLAPLGDVYQASTFSGNPMVMQAGLSTLKVLKKKVKEYRRLKKLTEYLVCNLKKEARIKDLDLNVNYWGNMFSLKFKTKQAFQGFYKSMLNQGIYLAPSEFEANFLSLAHSQNDIKNTIKAAKEAFKAAKRR